MLKQSRLFLKRNFLSIAISAYEELKMENETNSIKNEMQDTKQALVEKLGMIGDQVREQIDTTKERVSDKVDSIKENFSIKHQVETHPIGAVSAAVVAGLAIGSLANSRRASRTYTPNLESSSAKEWINSAEMSRGPSMISKLADRFSDEINMVKGMVAGVVAKNAREFISQKYPKFAPEVTNVIHSMAAKFGAPEDQSSPTDYPRSAPQREDDFHPRGTEKEWKPGSKTTVSA
jgi:hypothetical protein